MMVLQNAILPGVFQGAMFKQGKLWRVKRKDSKCQGQYKDSQEGQAWFGAGTDFAGQNSIAQQLAGDNGTDNEAESE